MRDNDHNESDIPDCVKIKHAVCTAINWKLSFLKVLGQFQPNSRSTHCNKLHYWTTSQSNQHSSQMATVMNSYSCHSERLLAESQFRHVVSLCHQPEPSAASVLPRLDDLPETQLASTMADTVQSRSTTRHTSVTFTITINIH